MTENTLIIAFDGLDKQLIEDFDLEHVKQEEFGSIDNDSGMTARMTSELFASFISGTNHEDHGATNLAHYPDTLPAKLAEEVRYSNLITKVRGLHRLQKVLTAGMGERPRKYTKEDLDTITWFEKVSNSRAMFVPSYNPSKFWLADPTGPLMEQGFSTDEVLRFWDSREYEYRKNALFEEFEKFGARNLLMCHFHRPDEYQHHYGDPEIKQDRDKLLKIYLETDDLAKKIKKRAQDAGYDRIIFMSDHGVPSSGEHNKNAFYSSNFELFGSKTPHITDFHDPVVEMASQD